MISLTFESIIIALMSLGNFLMMLLIGLMWKFDRRLIALELQQIKLLKELK